MRAAEPAEVGLALLEEGGERLDVGGAADHARERGVFAGARGPDRVDAAGEDELLGLHERRRPACTAMRPRERPSSRDQQRVGLDDAQREAARDRVVGA